MNASTEPRKISPRAGDALILVDLQNDFLPGGSLAVPHGDEVVAPLNRCIDVFRASGLPIYATRDWHTSNHCSFKDFGGIWPVHCVADTEGAAFAPGLRLPPSAEVISKATTEDVDSYSGFRHTELDAKLKEAGVKRLFVGGLATDYCVLNTVDDALGLGYKVLLIEDAVRAVNVHPEDGAKAEAEMRRRGAVLIQSRDLVPDSARGSERR
jgi:nicotinamidase/pyrazinamidase